MGQKKRTAGQGLRLLLIRDYLYNEASKEHPKNAKKIQEFLQEHRIAASTKTIYTDIMRLKEDLELPIAYSGKGERGFYITEKPFDPAELRLMIDCMPDRRSGKTFSGNSLCTDKNSHLHSRVLTNSH